MTRVAWIRIGQVPAAAPVWVAAALLGAAMLPTTGCVTRYPLPATVEAERAKRRQLGQRLQQLRRRLVETRAKASRLQAEAESVYTGIAKVTDRRDQVKKTLAERPWRRRNAPLLRLRDRLRNFIRRGPIYLAWADRTYRLGKARAAARLLNTRPNDRPWRWCRRLGAVGGVTVHDRQLIVTAGREPKYGSRVATSGVYVIAPRTGKVKQTIPLRAGDGDALGVAVDKSGLVVTTTRPSVLYVDWSGRRRWAQPLSSVARVPILADVDGDGTREVVVVGSRGRVTAFDAKTGRPRWVHRQPLPRGRKGFESVDAAVWEGQRLVYAQFDGRVVALDGRRGTVRWTVKTWQSGRLFVADLDGNRRPEVALGYVVWDALTGKQRWEAPANNETHGIGAYDARRRCGVLWMVKYLGPRKTDYFFGCRHGKRLVWRRETSVSDVVGLADVTGDGRLDLIATNDDEVTLHDVFARKSVLSRKIIGPFPVPPLVVDADQTGVNEMYVADAIGYVCRFDTKGTARYGQGHPRANPRNTSHWP